MTKWKYKTVPKSFFCRVDEKINKIASEGWELIAADLETLYFRKSIKK